jgi:hypothetical protein
VTIPTHNRWIAGGQLYVRLEAKKRAKTFVSSIINVLVMFCHSPPFGFQLLDDNNFRIWWHCVTVFHTHDFNIYSYNTTTHSLMYPNQFAKTCFFVSLLLLRSAGEPSVGAESRIELGLSFSKPTHCQLIHTNNDVFTVRLTLNFKV